MPHQTSLEQRRTFLASLVSAGALAAVPLKGFAATPPSGRPIVLGMQADLTGALAHDGLWEQRALLAAVDWHNRNGGIAGRPIKLVVVDTETKTDVGIRRLQQLIQDEHADFVVGSGSGGIAVASVPIAKEAQVVYLPLSRTDSITQETANPYLYRFVGNSSIAARACQEWMTKTIGKRWTMLISDIAYGHSQKEAFTAGLKSVGGEVVQTIALPMNTSDPLTYLLRLDKTVDGIVTAFWGPDSVRIYPALSTAGFGKKPKIAVSSSANLFDVLKLGSSVEDLYTFDEVPWELADYPDPKLTKTAFSAIGIGATGRSAAGDDYVMLPSVVIAWEYVSFLKRAIEGSGWAERKDGLKLSGWVAANPKFAQGEMFLRPDLFVRPEDQQAFADTYIMQVRNARMRMVKRVAAQESVYPFGKVIER
jgi:branched-chain amino acid transport system substrate-binding protein